MSTLARRCCRSFAQELILSVDLGLTAECLRDDVARDLAATGNLLKSWGCVTANDDRRKNSRVHCVRTGERVRAGVLCVATSMANALRFHAVVAGKTLRLPDLGAFEGERVEVIVVEDEGSERPMPARTRRFGTMAGEIEVASDFDAPLPEDIQAGFDGGVEH